MLCINVFLLYTYKTLSACKGRAYPGSAGQELDIFIYIIYLYIHKTLSADNKLNPVCVCVGGGGEGGGKGCGYSLEASHFFLFPDENIDCGTH